MTHGRSIAALKGAQGLLAGADILQLYLISRQLLSPDSRARLIPDTTRTADGLPPETSAWLRREIDGLDVFNAVSTLELRHYLANTLLRDGDAMSMAHGLEVRVPYLDHELVEHLFQLDTHVKVRAGCPKPLLVDVVDGRLPHDVSHRSKMGFTFPWELWLRGRLRRAVEQTIHESTAGDTLGLDRREAARLWARFLAHDPRVTWSRVWAMYSLLIWTERHMP
jgi:asparagine synthase (glutamine-hydrolysing)